MRPQAQPEHACEATRTHVRVVVHQLRVAMLPRKRVLYPLKWSRLWLDESKAPCLTGCKAIMASEQ